MRRIFENLLARAQEILVRIRGRIRYGSDPHELIERKLRIEIAALERRIEALGHRQVALAVRLDSLA